MDGLGVVVMAAGRGTRMRSEQAKVLHQIVGRPMIRYALDVARAVAGHSVAVVVGHQAGQVRAVLESALSGQSGGAAVHIVEHVPRLASEWVRRLGDAECEQMSVDGADFDGVQTQHARSIGGGLRLARAVAVIREDDEFEAGARGAGGHLVGRAAAVRTRRMDVKVTGDGAVRSRRERGAARRHCQRGKGRDDREREQEKTRPAFHGSAGMQEGPGTHSGVRPASLHACMAANYLRPAAAFSAAALSVRSHVNSGSVRPK